MLREACPEATYLRKVSVGVKKLSDICMRARRQGKCFPTHLSNRWALPIRIAAFDAIMTDARNGLVLLRLRAAPIRRDLGQRYFRTNARSIICGCGMVRSGASTVTPS